MTTRENPIITPAVHDDAQPRQTASGVQRELSGVYVNPAPTSVDPDRDMDVETTQELQSQSQGPAPTSGEHSRGEDLGTPHLAAEDSSDMNQRWQRIQAEFVDDPRRAVGDAHALVGQLVQRIVDGFAKERDGLEKQWSQGDNVSTEDLRVCLQNYRAFFSRLLPSADAMKH